MIPLTKQAAMTRSTSIKELDDYAKMTLEHSKRQYARHGTLHDVAQKAFSSSEIWNHPWVPDDFDYGLMKAHPIFITLSRKQQLALNHLQWGLEYTVVGQGERQIITLNNQAVSQFSNVLPSVIELEERESFEEVDHLAAFQEGLDALQNRYFPNRKTALWSIPASGFRSEWLNQRTRRLIGAFANHLLGSNFPTLFFLTRGIKTHNFKPFENAIANHEPTPSGIREVSHLHRLDESRHMATALNIARLSAVILDDLPNDSRLLFKMALKAAWPTNRMWDYRVQYWSAALESPIFETIHTAEKNALLAHVRTHTAATLKSLHPRQKRLTRQANKRIVESCGLSPEMKKLFVHILRQDEQHAPLVEAVNV